MKGSANPSASVPVRPRADGRLVEQFGVSRSMRRFVERMRLRIKDVAVTDPARASEFERCCATMPRIPEKKKIIGSDAGNIIRQTLDAAADHQLERLRRDRSVGDLARSRKDLCRLIKHIDGLADPISRLSPLSIGKLNTIVVQQNWRDFDTETFLEIMHGMQEALFSLFPACRADAAHRYWAC